MAYCTISDVQIFAAKFPLSTSTTPTSTQVETLIDLVAAQIDSVLLSKGYTVPVTTPTEFVNSLRLLNAQGAEAMALMAQFPGGASKDSIPQYQSILELYQAGLKALRNGEMPIALGKSGTGGMGSLYTSPSTNQSTYPDPVFSISPNSREF
jgi:hypothetical protein